VSVDPEQRLLELLSGKWVTAAIAAAAELGLADALAAGPLALPELAGRLGCDESALARLLGVLCAEGLLELASSGAYRITELGAQLRQGALRDLARFVGAPFMWTPWASLASAVRDARSSAFERLHGESLFQHLDHDERDAALYHRAVDAFTRRQARALAEVFDFSALGSVVDIGGGLGTLLVELTARFAALRCILYDRPAVIAQARAVLGSSPEGARIETVSGDFFTSVPQGADAYVIKHVLHNWGDDEAVRLLSLCANALRANGRVLIVENLLLPGNVRDAARLFDLEMFVLCGPGRERSKPEFRRLLHRAGLRLESSRALAGGTRLLVAAPRAER
jgi:SAM-dependent methyltransferase